jgi:predicted N-acetyltransferase YhbS
MEFRAAHRSERDQVLDLLAHWYNDREFFARYNCNDPTFRDELCLVAIDGGRIVSTVQIFDRKIRLGGQVVPMGGIGSVFTLDEYRHRRVASELMELSLRTMAQNDFEVSLLFAERLGFYNQFGWKEVTRNFSVIAGAANLQAPTRFEPTKFEIDVFDSARDLDEVIRIHEGYSGNLDVISVRNHPDWVANLTFAGNMPADPIGGCEEYFILAREHRDIAAYGRVTKFHGIAMLMEYGYEHGHIDALLALIRHLGETAANSPSSYRTAGDHKSSSLLRGDNGAGASVLVTHSQHDANLESALAEAGCPVTHHADNNYMWRVILPEKLGARFGLSPVAATPHAFSRFSDPHSLFWTSDRF